ncbi:hypothetical protein BDV25DRAFT_44480 [Aspergillus avenaceus]|uniref:Secreted protein n=1 Tax=Aspergillus avenaceus TaxID=36643 RepID=A0A5N6TKE9_ASPAV|nr:hypothetical protein BDV25DRAFT_44480 [Aspergillus avenaceus]
MFAIIYHLQLCLLLNPPASTLFSSSFDEGKKEKSYSLNDTLVLANFLFERVGPIISCSITGLESAAICLRPGSFTPTASALSSGTCLLG